MNRFITGFNARDCVEQRDVFKMFASRLSQIFSGLRHYTDTVSIYDGEDWINVYSGHIAIDIGEHIIDNIRTCGMYLDTVGCANITHGETKSDVKIIISKPGILGKIADNAEIKVFDFVNIDNVKVHATVDVINHQSRNKTFEFKWVIDVSSDKDCDYTISIIIAITEQQLYRLEFDCMEMWAGINALAFDTFVAKSFE